MEGCAAGGTGTLKCGWRAAAASVLGDEIPLVQQQDPAPASFSCSGRPLPSCLETLTLAPTCRSNFITDRPSSRVLAPPGGVTSWSLGGDMAPPAPKPRPAAGVSGEAGV